MAISEMSNSSPRTIRRNAWMMAGTSSKSKSNVRGFTVPSFKACVCPRVTSAVLSFVRSMRRQIVFDAGSQAATSFGPAKAGHYVESG